MGFDLGFGTWALTSFSTCPSADVNRPVRERGDVGFVCHEHDGVARLVKLRKQRHDLGAGLRVEVAGRLVGQQDRWIVDERARDGHALALAAGQLVRAMRHPVAELDALERRAGALAPDPPR